jgi:hypothetical protein
MSEGLWKDFSLHEYWELSIVSGRPTFADTIFRLLDQFRSSGADRERNSTQTHYKQSVLTTAPGLSHTNGPNWVGFFPTLQLTKDENIVSEAL